MAKKKTLAVSVAGLTLVGGMAVQSTFADTDASDFGMKMKVQQLLEAQSNQLFGIKKPLPEPADAGDYVPREAAEADERVLLAKGLKAQFVARNVAKSGDMISFWPNADDYTHLMVCIEQGRQIIDPDPDLDGDEIVAGSGTGLNAGLQRVNVTPGPDYGKVETILFGMSRCDGIRTTSWGTVLATEETSDGRAYEIIDPLNTTGHWIYDRENGDIRDAIDSETASETIVQRPYLPTMAWEGLTVLDSGVVIGGDELRPGSYQDDFGSSDTDGGAIFKFVPELPRTTDELISDLDDSPLAFGSVYAMQVSCRDSRQQFGQGCEIGNAAWVAVSAENARVDANNNGATGYYRPEDLHKDPMYDGEGVRFCWANTGNEGAQNFGEVICGVDSEPLTADADSRTVVVNRLVEGDKRFTSADNLDIQSKTGNVYVIEDHIYGEVWACLPDGADRDIKTDGCISIASVVDPDAEPTGFIFDGSAAVAFIIVQHGEQPEALLDFESNPVDGKTDDLIMITGFKVK